MTNAIKRQNSYASIIVYYSFIFPPYLSCCNNIRGVTNISATNLQKRVIHQKQIFEWLLIWSLETLQVHVVRLENRESLTSLMSIKCWLGALCMNNIMSSWSIFYDYFQCVRNEHHHNTRPNYGFYANHMKTDLGQICIGYSGPIIWNKIIGIQINPPGYLWGII